MGKVIYKLPKLMKVIEFIHIYNLKLNGLLKFYHENNFSANLRANIICFVITLTVILVLTTVVLEEHSLVDDIVGIVNVLCSVSGVIKIKVFGHRKDILKGLMEDVFDPKWEVVDVKYIYLVIMYIQSAAFISILWVVTPLILNNLRIVPFPIYVPFDSNNESVIISRYVLSFIVIVLIVTTNLAGDISFMLAAILIKQKTEDTNNQLKISQHFLDQKNVDASLKSYLAKHLNTIRTFHVLGDYMNVIFVLQVIASTIMICVIALSVGQVNDLFELVKLIMAGATIFSQLLLFCLFGQVIHDEFELLHTSMFWSGWYRCTIQQQKSISICQAITSRHVWIRGGGVFTASLKTLMNSVRESMSYFMFLRTILRKAKEQGAIT